VLLDRTPNWHPWLRFAILAGAAVAVVGLLASRRLTGMLSPAVATTAAVAALAGPTAYTLSTVANASTGGIPSAGPVVKTATGFPGAGSGSRARGGAGDSATRALAAQLKRGSARYTWAAATSSAMTAASLQLSSGKPVMAIGGFSGRDPSITLARFEQIVAQGKIHYYVADAGFGGAPGGVPGGPPPGGFPRGGFPGGGARAGRAPGGGPLGGTAGNGVESQIRSWVSSHFKSSTVGGVTVYDLTQPKAG
jgi:hypothetical protein